MLTVGQLGRDRLAAALAGGLTLCTGPFRVCVRSQDGGVLRGLSSLYADLAVAEPSGFRDFHTRVDRVAGVRRWLRPQVDFWAGDLRPFKPLPVDHAFALLEWGMNWCIATQAHHYLLIHAAVVERHGHCVLLPGEPGAGKSTLTAALALSGWRLLSDEMTIVDRDDGLIAPLCRPVSLKNESIDIVRRRFPDAVFGDVARDTHKGTVSHLKPPSASVARMHDKGRARHVVFPRWRAGAATTLTPRPKADAFMHLATHAFNYSLLGRLGFELNAALIDACDCWDFEYSDLDDALRVFEELVA